ncbi:MAG TPA: prepilin-type N-terminal cleavage/methylation domain-containing protein [Sedimentisphaerales bacterium]|nr:prepilin-type N-terminal cleavage/methylation domain-containing protein [Sedimentisphaerales bacterium]
MRAKSGFTLVEILIVVVILGILAAIVIPQFTDASTEAKLSSLCSDLQTLRSQIELYKIQHNDFPPSLANFVAQMTAKTDIYGAAGTDYGPYLRKIPMNPFNDMDGIDASGTIGDDGGGWEYDSNGEIHADDSWDEDGVAGFDHANL